MNPSLHRTAFVLALSFLAALPLKADSFANPEIQAFRSEDKTHIFCVVPAGYQDPQYPHPRTSPHIQAFLASNAVCVGSLMKYSEQMKRYYPLWTRPLSSKVSPTTALVTDDGKYVVTIGEWFGGPEDGMAIGIYDADGKLIRTLTPKDILGVKALEEVPRTDTMILWGKDPEVDSSKHELIIQVWESGHGMPGKPKIFRKQRIKLADGTFVK